uniref:FtsX-like permease family protein n=1 Tax=Alcanivorax sp. TaxID=1872427 RepID=UPI002583FBFD
YGILLGKELAESLGVTVGDKVTLIAPEASITVVGVLPRFKRMMVVGIFSAGMYEYDAGLAVMSIADARKIYRYPKDTVTALTLRLDDLFAVEAVRKALAQRLSETLYTIDWTQRHANFFKAVHMEKRMMFIVLALIIMVAAFNIVSMMVMVVTDKQADIAILKTLGATPGSIMLLFMVQGVAIGAVGILIGVTAGVALALNLEVVVPFIEHLLGIRFFPPDIYYISEVPSRLEGGDVEAVAILAFLLTLAATLYPSWRAARIQPAEALRYE